ncbi:MAG: hypothetical protein NW703_09650 [Nitrospiraceae bacterium]
MKAGQGALDPAMKEMRILVVTVLGLMLVATLAFLWMRQEPRPLSHMVSPLGHPLPSSSRVGTSALSHGGPVPESLRNSSRKVTGPNARNEEVP